MKALVDFINESLENENIQESNETIKSESDFRAWAEAKFKEVFGDDYDEDKMKETVDGFLEDNAELVEQGEWGELVGMMNQSFAPDNK